MAESSSYSSLLALVDDHLSKTKIQGSRSEAVGGLQVPSFSGIQNGTQSETRMSPNAQDLHALPIPSFNIKNSSIANVLAEQVANMLKAKERKLVEEEERLKLETEMKNLAIKEREANDCVIDLMKALQAPPTSGVYLKRKSETISSTSSLESLFEPIFISCDIDDPVATTPEPILPCRTDMSFILNQSIKRKGKCSNFGKVLASRYKPVAAPYLKEKIDSSIIRFDFKTKSPCDLIKEKLLWKPAVYAYNSQTDVGEVN